MERTFVLLLLLREEAVRLFRRELEDDLLLLRGEEPALALRPVDLLLLRLTD